MKPGMSSLNPYAESYIPISKRETNLENKSSPILKAVSPKNDTGFSNSPYYKDPKQSRTRPYESFGYNLPAIEKLLISEDSRTGQQNLNPLRAKQIVDDDFEMDLAYLTTVFPSVSEQSLAGVYSANGGDLDASMEMLNHLELYPVDVSKHLPDTLDIGDVSELKTPAEASSVQLKSINSGESSSSSSDVQQGRSHGV